MANAAHKQGKRSGSVVSTQTAALTLEQCQEFPPRAVQRLLNNPDGSAEPAAALPLGAAAAQQPTGLVVKRAAVVVTCCC